MYLSNFAAMRTASSVQLSASMNSSGTPVPGAVTTTSARALPIAGFFQVPFTGSATSVGYEVRVPIPSGASTAACAAATASAG